MWALPQTLRYTNRGVDRELVPPLFAPGRPKRVRAAPQFFLLLLPLLNGLFWPFALLRRGLFQRRWGCSVAGASVIAAAVGVVSRLRARPKGAALWIPEAFEKAGEIFAGAMRGRPPPKLFPSTHGNQFSV